MHVFRVLLVLLSAACAASGASAQQAPSHPAAAGACAPRLSEAWIRLPPNPAVPMAAGFGRLENPCAAGIAVVSADSAAFGEISIHESREADGVNRMRELARLVVAAGDTALLRPGGLHLMLLRPRAPLQAGQSLPIRLVLEDGRVVAAEFEVRRAVPAEDVPMPAHHVH